MKKTNDIAIDLKNITKEYVIHHEKPTLVEKFYKGREEKFIALNNISLTIKKGERVGIIGPNGSGKTTLLKIIAGITTPTRGTVNAYGKVVSLIDLEAGFHPDLTGYQNIFLNGMLLGMKKKEIEKKLHTIITFADIHQFIDAPMFTYSSGMALRLGFAVAVHANPDILILDENISAGDRLFQHKIEQKIEQLLAQDRTILIASHYQQIIKQYTNKVFLVDHGKIIKGENKKLYKKYFV